MYFHLEDSYSSFGQLSVINVLLRLYIQVFLFFLVDYFQNLTGVAGVLGLHVQGLVEEELSPGLDTVASHVLSIQSVLILHQLYNSEPVELDPVAKVLLKNSPNINRKLQIHFPDSMPITFVGTI